MTDGVIDVGAHVIDVAAQDENLLHYLGGLSDEQLAGYENFKAFMVGQLPISVLRGAGGTGKTYSVARWCMAFGLKPDEVIGLAPTNAAAAVLRKSLHSSGFFCEVSTIHSFLGLGPSKPSWDARNDAELRELKEKLPNLTSPVEIAQTAARITILKNQLQCFRDSKLVFSMPESSWFESPEGVRLYIIDECSMISAELNGLLDGTLLVNDRIRILKQGDDLQLFPIKEGRSPSFDSPSIADFQNVRRSTGALRDLNMAMRQSQDVNVAYRILRSLPRYTGTPLEDGQACTINRAQAKEIFGQWSKDLPRDGESYRYLAFTRDVVDKINTASLQFARQPCPPVGSYIVADSPVSRYCPDEMGFNKNKTILFNGEKVAIEKALSPYKSNIPGFGAIDVYPFLVKCGDDEDMYDRRRDLPGTRAKLNPLNHFLGRGEYIELGRYNIVRWTNDPNYYNALEFWGKIKNALYSPSKPPLPSANESVEMFFEWLGMESWNNIKEIPGYKTYKPKDLNLDVFLDPNNTSARARAEFMRKICDDDGAIVCEIFRNKKHGLRHQILLLYMWLAHNVVDPIKPLAASTVHKSQGGSVERVMIDLEDIYKSRHYGDKGGENTYRALYTAMSRASRQLYVIVD
jgi:hypothetical protein